MIDKESRRACKLNVLCISPKMGKRLYGLLLEKQREEQGWTMPRIRRFLLEKGLDAEERRRKKTKREGV